MIIILILLALNANFYRWRRINTLSQRIVLCSGAGSLIFLTSLFGQLDGESYIF